MRGTLEFVKDEAEQTRRAYETADIAGQRHATRALLALETGESVLDIGCGPGFLAAEMAGTVGPPGAVHGVDISNDMLAMARDHCAALSTVSFQQADATDLPFADGAFDAAVSTQVCAYVTDIEAALAELHRVLRPGGRALILDTDDAGILLNSEEPARMAQVMAAWRGHAVHPHLPRRLNRLLTDAGFAVVRWDLFPIFNLTYDPDFFGYWMIDSIHGFAPGQNGVTQETADEWLDEQQALADKGAYFFSVNRYIFLASKPN